MRQAFTIGVYNPAFINQASPYCGDNVFAKGLEENGYEVTRFDYRAHKDPNFELMQKFRNVLAASLLTDKPISIVWFGKCETITPATIKEMKYLLPDATFVKWAADVRDEPAPHDVELLKAGIDWFFGTFGGEYLKKHLFSNMKGVASIITFTDSSYYVATEVDDKYVSDVLWTGRRGFGDNLLRNDVIDKLQDIVANQMKQARDPNALNIKMFGHDGKSWLGDPDYVRYINGAKIGIGSNSFLRTKYSSDRMGNYMACGTFYLTQYIEGIEQVFRKGVHLDWFNSVSEMMTLIDFYLKNPELRYKIAQRGREKVLRNFDAKPLTLDLLRIIKTKEKQHPWDELFLN